MGFKRAYLFYFILIQLIKRGRGRSPRRSSMRPCWRRSKCPVTWTPWRDLSPTFSRDWRSTRMLFRVTKRLGNMNTCPVLNHKSFTYFYVLTKSSGSLIGKFFLCLFPRMKRHWKLVLRTIWQGSKRRSSATGTLKPMPRRKLASKKCNILR